MIPANRPRWPSFYAALILTFAFLGWGQQVWAAQVYRDSVTVKIERVVPEPPCKSLISSLMTPTLFQELPAPPPPEVDSYLDDQSGQVKVSALNSSCMNLTSNQAAGVDLRVISKDDVFPLLLLAAQNTARASGLPFLQRLEIEGGFENGKAYGSLTSVQPLWHDQIERNHVLMQLSWFRTNDSGYADTVNAGLAYRHLSKSEKWLIGGNVFLDHAYGLNHNRLSVGLEARTSLVALSINRYIPLSDWKTADAQTQERASGGWDVEFRGQALQLPSWTGTLKGYTWDAQGDDPRTYGAEAGVEYSPFELLTVRAGVRDESRADPSAQLALRLNWRFDQDRKTQLQPRLQLASVKERVYDKVQRENRTRISQRRTVGTAPIVIPAGYAVAFTSGPLTPANHTAASFTLSGGEIGATYDYTISSSGGGVNVTGSGLVTSAPQNFGPIDVSAMQDGTLTVSIFLTNTSGGIGLPVTDTETKNARFICGSVGENGIINLTAPVGEVFTSVEFASYGTPAGACGGFTLGACHAANSVALTSAVFLGNNSGSITASNGVFGDPCGGTLKNMRIQLRY